MPKPYRNDPPAGEFSDAHEKFVAIERWLTSDEAGSRAHGDIEAQLNQDGRELLRLLFQGHLDLRAHREKRGEAIEGSDRAVRGQVRRSGRPLMTVFGPVRVARLQYAGRGVASLFPADAVLNLPAEEHSHGLRRHVAEEAARGSFDDVVSSIARNTGGKVAKRQAEELAERASRDFDAFYAQRTAATPEQSNDLMILSLDGKGIVMRPDALRDATRKSTARSHKLRRRLSAGEKLGNKRMATVAAVYSVAAQPRTAHDVLRELAPVRDVSKPRPRPVNKRVWASVAKSADDVCEEVFQEALRRDPHRRRTWVALVDGDPHQLDRLFSASNTHDVDLLVVLDFIHVLEYLWDAAWCFHATGDPAAETWVTERAKAVLEGNSSNVAAAIRRSATLRGLSGPKRKTIDLVAGYLLKHREMLRYDLALEQGWPIATGVIEGACRYLVKDRMDITGARWGLTGAEAVLKLRALRTSGDLDGYWQFHLQREQQRNHLSNYAPESLPCAG